MKREKYVIDRIEDGMLVLENSENGTELVVPKGSFDSGLCENDIVQVVSCNGEIKEITADLLLFSFLIAIR